MQPIEDPMNWNADVVRDEAAWRIETPAALADELVLAARRAVADGAPADAVDRRRFDCPGLADFAGRIHAALEDGMGFAVVAGLPTDRLDHAGQTALALGVPAASIRACCHSGGYDTSAPAHVTVAADGLDNAHRPCPQLASG